MKTNVGLVALECGVARNEAAQLGKRLEIDIVGQLAGCKVVQFWAKSMEVTP